MIPQTPGVADHAAPEQPEPVRDAARLGGLLSAFLVACGGVVALFVGGFGLEDLGPLGVAIGAAVTAGIALAVYLVSLWQGLRARAKVTPLARPRNDHGQPLVALPGVSDGPRP